MGVGLYPDFGVAHRLISAAKAEQPDPVAHRRYGEIYALFRDAYRSMEPLFPRLAALAV